MTRTIMEQAGKAGNQHGNQPIHDRLGAPNARPSKRIKELENAALQTHLTSVVMELEAACDCGSSRGREESKGSGEQLNGLSHGEVAAPRQPDDASPQQVNSPTEENKDQAEERTLTDHLNKRLLSSFLEKLNQRDLALPGIQRLDCAVADEDSNRGAVDEW